MTIFDDELEVILSIKQAVNDIDKDEWVKAMDLEMELMYSTSVWDLVDWLDRVKPTGCKWIYKRKIDVDGKVRLLRLG